MNIAEKGLAAEIRGLSSLYQLLCAPGLPRDICLLIIYPERGAVLGESSEEKSAVKRFLAEAPFITAAVCDDDTGEELGSAADLRITPEEAEGYAERLFSGKSGVQIREITACFAAARTAPAERVLEMESEAFYRLMALRNGGDGHE